MVRVLEELHAVAQVVCPHWCGWCTNAGEDRRWCRVCGYEEAWENVVTDDEVRVGWRPLYATELRTKDVERIVAETRRELERWG